MYIGKVQMEAVLIMSVNISLIGTPIPPYPSTLLHGRLRQIDDIQLATLQLSTAAHVQLYKLGM